MTKRYQIVKIARDDTDPRWQFVAHGARYSDEGSREMCALIERDGAWKTKRLPI